MERALTVLKVFETKDEPVTLSHIAIETGLYKSTILRLLLSFEGFGYIRRTEEGLYTLGPGVFRLGVKYRKQFRLDTALNAVLQGLVDQGTESASFHIREGHNRVCIARIDSNHPTLDRVSVGDVRPLTLGAASKVIRAFSDNLSDPEFEDVRQSRIAFSYGEIDPSCWAIASPVFTISGRVLGAISLSGPKERFTQEAILRMRTLLLDAAKELSDMAIADNLVSPAGQYRVLVRT
ncbi:IclR family transcriptional regulator [Microvirga pakistanensis]|uniref:IclR family transcriptional regulator n=1 Tax=Microvirga pakistanensis TaxID=1682650 RepID=UPI00141BAAB8|nr:IclR family transcriptional regulator [Microvirga pakistanensis]